MSTALSPMRSIGIGPKFTLLSLGISAVLALLLTWFAASRTEQHLVASGIAEGESLATSFAATAERSGAADPESLKPLLEAFRGTQDVLYLYVQDGEGQILAHTFPENFPLSLLQVNPLKPGELGPGQRVKVAQSAEVTVAGQEQDVIDVAAPLAGKLNGVVHVGVGRQATDDMVFRLWRDMLLLALVLVLLGLGATYLLGRTVVQPLTELTAVAAHIVESGDLNRSVTVRGGDEVGQLAGSFAQMVDRLRTVTVSLQEASSSLDKSSTELTASSTQQSQTVSRQAAALQETQVTAQEIRQTSLLASEKAEAVLAVVERADQLSRSGQDAIEQTMTGLNEIREQVGEIAKKILQLGERTTQIGTITETVKDLADQSNMLALNAAIEAVRSGEHGKGFQVVAREIRALADQSIEATTRVRELLDEISNSVQAAVVITERGSKRVETGLEQVRNYGKNLRELSAIVQDNAAAVRQIAAAVNQQNVGINQITSAVTDLSKMMDETVARIGATAEATASLQLISEQLSGVVKTYRV